jgi:hypothetical protein
MILKISYATTLEGDNAFWSYDFLPDSWELTDSLSIPFYDSKGKDYPFPLRTDIFQGNKKNYKFMKAYLKTFFENLIKEKIIDFYKILDKND